MKKIEQDHSSLFYKIIQLEEEIEQITDPLIYEEKSIQLQNLQKELEMMKSKRSEIERDLKQKALKEIDNIIDEKPQQEKKSVIIMQTHQSKTEDKTQNEINADEFQDF